MNDGFQIPRELSMVHLNYRAAAQYLQVSVRSLERLVQRQEIECLRIGKRVLFRRDVLDLWCHQKIKSSASTIYP